MNARFTQSCPTCGRRIQIRISLIGRTVQCSHCKSEFRALAGNRPKSEEVRMDDSAAENSELTYQNEQIRPPAVEDLSSAASDRLMERVERVLAQSNHSKV